MLGGVAGAGSSSISVSVHVAPLPMLELMELPSGAILTVAGITTVIMTDAEALTLLLPGRL